MSTFLFGVRLTTIVPCCDLGALPMSPIWGIALGPDSWRLLFLTRWWLRNPGMKYTLLLQKIVIPYTLTVSRLLGKKSCTDSIRTTPSHAQLRQRLGTTSSILRSLVWKETGFTYGRLCGWRQAFGLYGYVIGAILKYPAIENFLCQFSMYPWNLRIQSTHLLL